MIWSQSSPVIPETMEEDEETDPEEREENIWTRLQTMDNYLLLFLFIMILFTVFFLMYLGLKPDKECVADLLANKIDTSPDIIRRCVGHSKPIDCLQVETNYYTRNNRLLSISKATSRLDHCRSGEWSPVKNYVNFSRMISRLHGNFLAERLFESPLHEPTNIKQSHISQTGLEFCDDILKQASFLSTKIISLDESVLDSRRRKQQIIWMVKNQEPATGPLKFDLYQETTASNCWPICKRDRCISFHSEVAHIPMKLKCDPSALLPCKFLSLPSPYAISESRCSVVTRVLGPEHCLQNYGGVIPKIIVSTMLCH